eukprot:gene3452-6088_t
MVKQLSAPAFIFRERMAGLHDTSPWSCIHDLKYHSIHYTQLLLQQHPGCCRQRTAPTQSQSVSCASNLNDPSNHSLTLKNNYGLSSSYSAHDSLFSVTKHQMFSFDSYDQLSCHCDAVPSSKSEMNQCNCSQVYYREAEKLAADLFMLRNTIVLINFQINIDSLLPSSRRYLSSQQIFPHFSRFPHVLSGDFHSLNLPSDYDCHIRSIQEFAVLLLYEIEVLGNIQPMLLIALSNQIVCALFSLLMFLWSFFNCCHFKLLKRIAIVSNYIVIIDYHSSLIVLPQWQQMTDWKKSFKPCRPVDLGASYGNSSFISRHDICRFREVRFANRHSTNMDVYEINSIIGNNGLLVYGLEDNIILSGEQNNDPSVDSSKEIPNNSGAGEAKKKIAGDSIHHQLREKGAQQSFYDHSNATTFKKTEEVNMAYNNGDKQTGNPKIIVQEGNGKSVIPNNNSFRNSIATTFSGIAFHGDSDNYYSAHDQTDENIERAVSNENYSSDITKISVHVKPTSSLITDTSDQLDNSRTSNNQYENQDDQTHDSDDLCDTIDVENKGEEDNDNESLEEEETLIKLIEFSLSRVNPLLVCKLCAGYFINATTIAECLHTFCKTCIIKHFESNNSCPTCGVVAHETCPEDMLRQDRTIQSIVYKLIPRLLEGLDVLLFPEVVMSCSIFECSSEENARQRESSMAAMEDVTGLTKPSEAVESVADSESEAKRAKIMKRRTDPQVSFMLERELSHEESGIKSKDLERPFIRTSSHATILHLKKFLARKLHLPKADDVDVLCRGEVLGKEYTLEYVMRTRWRKPSQLMLAYRPRTEHSL